MTSITQDMKFRQSLMKYSRKYGVSRASRKYNKARSYIYFWLNRWDGNIQSLATQSKRPHHHPNEHTPEEIALIRRFCKRNPELEITELWHRLKKKGYLTVLRLSHIACLGCGIARKSVKLDRIIEHSTELIVERFQIHR